MPEILLIPIFFCVIRNSWNSDSEWKISMNSWYHIYIFSMYNIGDGIIHINTSWTKYPLPFVSIISLTLVCFRYMATVHPMFMEYWPGCRSWLSSRYEDASFVWPGFIPDAWGRLHHQWSSRQRLWQTSNLSWDDSTNVNFINSHDQLIVCFVDYDILWLASKSLFVYDLWTQTNVFNFYTFWPYELVFPQVERTQSRPLACGDLSPLKALMYLAGHLSLSLIILLQFNWYRYASRLPRLVLSEM